MLETGGGQADGQEAVSRGLVCLEPRVPGSNPALPLAERP